MSIHEPELDWSRTQPDSGTDAWRWPDVEQVPAGAVRGRIAWTLLRRAVRRLPVRICMPDGTNIGGGGPRDPIMHLVRPECFARRLGASGLIGFGEAWMAGDWDTDDLVGVLTVFAGQVSALIPPRLQRLRDRALPRHPRDEVATVGGARANAAHHYDLSNDLFALFLDPSLTYSAALFPTDHPTEATFGELEAAQATKIDRLLDGAGVSSGTTLLEIGTGWGELAIRAAARGARVHSVTLSEEQRDLAVRRVAAAGHAGSVTIELCDYRDVEGTYDAVVSVEMIEAVGAPFWGGYFAAVDCHLSPGGRVGLQAITMPHDRMLVSRHTYTWMQKYIFPGGLIPSVEAIEEAVAARTALRPLDRIAFGSHYAHTLALWRERFEAAAAAVADLGFDATFRRMWSLYLAYSEAGFRSGYLDVHQFLFEKTR
ncbi:MAG: class I SAM-dependent methyltransferase [Acidimicrobiia bacterium]